MSVLYEELKKKALDESKNKDMVIAGRFVYPEVSGNYYGMTYSDLLGLVNVYIMALKDPRFTTQPIEGRRKYIVVDNSINSICSIIALLECGAIPVIIDGKNIEGIKEERLPYLEYGDNPEGNEVENYWLDYYLNKLHIDNNLPGEDKPGGKLIICSSGSEGAAPHLNLVREDDLVNLPNQYGEDNSTFLSYISCANISGILTNLVNFLIHDTKLLLSQNFDLETIYFANNYDKFLEKNFKRKYEEKRYFCSTSNPALMQLLFQRVGSFDGQFYDQIHIEDDELVVQEKRDDYQLISMNDKFFNLVSNNKIPHADTMMFPRNIVSYLEKADLEGVDLSSMRHIYLSGGINSEDVVKKVRDKIPSIPEGVFTNLYGSTEANGVICTCDEKDFRTCYINVGDYESRKISYTFDKKKFYEISNGVTKEIAPPSDLFEYMPYLNVSSKREESVSVDDKLRIKYKGQETGDFGIYIDDQLYVLGRKSDFIKLNGRTYVLHSLESYYSNEIGSKVYLRPIDEEALQLFIKEPQLVLNPELVLKFQKALDISLNTTRFHINPPVFLDDYLFPESKISGKISKPYLLLYNEYAKEQLENFRDFPNSIITKSKWFAERMANYSPVVMEDGTFFLNMSRRLILPVNDIILSFYKPMLTNKDDIIRFIPRPEIIFMIQEHVLFSNNKTMIDYNTGIIESVLYAGREFKESGIDVMEMKKPIDKSMTGEKLVEQLKYNIIVDVIRRYANKRQYEHYLSMLSDEEREKIQKELQSNNEKTDEDEGKPEKKPQENKDVKKKEKSRNKKSENKKPDNQ